MDSESSGPVIIPLRPSPSLNLSLLSLQQQLNKRTFDRQTALSTMGNKNWLSLAMAHLLLHDTRRPGLITTLKMGLPLMCG